MKSTPKRKFLISIVTAAILLATVTVFFVLPASAETYSGTCGAEGDNLTWALDTETGILAISGEGAMADWERGDVPWGTYSLDIKSVTIQNGVTSIGRWAFYNCIALTSITLPESVTSIGDRAFSSCSKLTSITLPESVDSIGKFAFYNCISLTSITLPVSMTSIGDQAFYFCNVLTSIILPASLKSIGEHTFFGCYSLASITLPVSLESIGDRAFAYCSSLKNVYNCSTLNLVKGSSGYGGVAQYAENIYKHRFMTPADGECVLKTPATCTTSAIYYLGDCISCGAKGEGTVAYGDPLGHTPDAETTCMTPQTCIVCSVRITPAPGHTPSATATCTTDEVCTVCAEILTPALGHTPGVSATCTEDQICTVCNLTLAPALGHTEVTLPAVAPTIFDDGLTEGKWCAVCELVFLERSIVPARIKTLSVKTIVLLAGGVLVIAVLLSVTVILIRKKKKQPHKYTEEELAWESKTKR